MKGSGGRFQPGPFFTNSASPSDYILPDHLQFSSYPSYQQKALLDQQQNSSWIFVLVLSIGGSVLLLIISVVLYDYCHHLKRTGVFREIRQRRRSELNFYRRVELRQPSRREGAVFLTTAEDEAPSSTHWRVGSSYVRGSIDSNSDLKALPLPPPSPSLSQPPSPLPSCLKHVDVEVANQPHQKLSRNRSDSDYEASSPLASGDSSSTEMETGGTTLLKQKNPVRFQEIKKALCYQLSPDSFLSNTTTQSTNSNRVFDLQVKLIDETKIQPCLLRPPPNPHHRSLSLCLETKKKTPKKHSNLPTPTAGDVYFDSGSDIPGGTVAMRRLLMTKGHSLDAMTSSKISQGGTFSPKQDSNVPRCRSASTIAELFILKYKMFLLDKVRRRKRAEILQKRRLRMAAFEGHPPAPQKTQQTGESHPLLHRNSFDGRKNSSSEETTLIPRKTKMLVIFTIFFVLNFMYLLHIFRLIHAMRIPLAKETSLFN